MQRSKKYRFLFVSALFTGNETFFQNFRDAMADREDVEFSWLPIELEPREFFAKIPWISSNSTLKNALVTRSRLALFEGSGKVFDAALINHVTPAYFLAGFMKRVPTIITLDVTPPLLDKHSFWYETVAPSSPENPLERLKRGWTRGIYERSASLMPWSTWVKQSLMTDYGINEEKIVVVPPGINLKLWPVPDGRASGLEYGRPLKVLFVGGHFSRKGGDLLLRVAQRPEFQNCEFHLVTKTYKGAPIKNMFLYTEAGPNSDLIRRLYREADIFVLPTRADFSPLALCEAMASGLPIVSTDVGGLKEIVEDGITGFIVPLDNEEILADRLKRLVDNPNLRMTMGRNGRRKAEERFNLEKNANFIVEHMKMASDHAATS